MVPGILVITILIISGILIAVYGIIAVIAIVGFLAICSGILALIVYKTGLMKKDESEYEGRC